MGLIDWFRGYSKIREIQAVFHKDGTHSPPHAVVTKYSLSGKYLGGGIGGELTKQEKKIYEKNPELIKESLFSYCPVSRIEEIVDSSDH